LPWKRKCDNSNGITNSDTYGNDSFAVTNSHSYSKFNSDANTYSDHGITNSIAFYKRFSYTDCVTNPISNH
jgi:hypothetical protein